MAEKEASKTPVLNNFINQDLSLISINQASKSPSPQREPPSLAKIKSMNLDTGVNKTTISYCAHNFSTNNNFTRNASSNFLKEGHPKVTFNNEI